MNVNASRHIVLQTAAKSLQTWLLSINYRNLSMPYPEVLPTLHKTKRKGQTNRQTTCRNISAIISMIGKKLMDP